MTEDDANPEYICRHCFDGTFHKAEFGRMVTSGHITIKDFDPMDDNDVFVSFCVRPADTVDGQ